MNIINELMKNKIENINGIIKKIDEVIIKNKENNNKEINDIKEKIKNLYNLLNIKLNEKLNEIKKYINEDKENQLNYIKNIFDLKNKLIKNICIDIKELSYFYEEYDEKIKDKLNEEKK